MAIIDGKAPQADQPEASPRVVVKLSRRVQAKEGGAQLDTSRGVLSELQRLAPGAAITSYFSEVEQFRGARLPPFNRYVAIEAPDRDAATALARLLNESGAVEEAYVEAGPVPPPVNPTDDPRSGGQGYLAAAPAGIDARWAWSSTDGSGIGFVDLERGWTLDHEDLDEAAITLISGQSRDYHGHGTAVLGEVVAFDNMRGGIGIAPEATARVVSQWRSASSYNTAAAILSAGDAMSAGDVLLLEAQTHIGSLQNMPVEVETAVFDAIRHVVDAGIIVVEAAGNGGNDLDTYRNAANRSVLDRNSADFRDSGAIMVGAASSAAPHSRLNFSNHGSRIDCYAWGENIDTTGDGWQGTSTTAYTTGFGGTSGASPIVTGAALLLQSWKKTRHGNVFSPEILRQRLSSASLNTASANPAADRIGVMPDLRAIIEAELALENFRFEKPEFALLAYVLFGLIDDSPGVIWVPGKGPVPVDPDWHYAKARPGPQRDLLAALAVNEIAAFIGDSRTRARIRGASVAAVRQAAHRLAGPNSERQSIGLLGRLFNLLFGHRSPAVGEGRLH